MEYLKVHFLTSTGETSHTIIFAGNTREDEPQENVFRVESTIHPDDSIRTIKMKLLHELHKGDNANKIQLRPSYEELYLYGFAKEETTTLQLLEAIKGDEEGADVPLDIIKQIISGHPDEASILRKLPAGDKIPYSEFEQVLTEKRIDIMVKIPLGITFAGGRRDPTFEVDPFNVSKHRAYLSEHNNLRYFDDSLLLNHGTIAENTVYVCLADRSYESAVPEAEEYIARYYFPGLYKEGVKSKETLISNRSKLVKTTQKLLSDERQQYYQSIDTFYKIANDNTEVKYISKGIKKITISLNNVSSKVANLEMLFKNMHCSREMPYIKFNPGNRRENLYRFYFERMTRNGKKIPFLSKSHIMRIAKETGKGLQISVYLEGALQGGVLSNCYVHFEQNGDIKLQLAFHSPVDERTLEDTISNNILPYLAIIGKDIRQTGYLMPVYTGLKNTKVTDMTIVSKTTITKNITWETIPCIYSICTLNTEVPGQPLVVRLKRVENFKEMDAVNILIAELYGQVQYGDVELHDIVNELVVRGLSADENAAKVSIAGFLASINEMNGEIVEKPGFPIELTVDSEDKTVEISVSGLTSILYLDTVGVYIDAIFKTTQIYKESNPLLKQLKKICKKALKFREVEKEPEVTTAIINEVTQIPPIFDGPLKLSKFTKDDDFFAQFESDEDEDIRKGPIMGEDEEDEESDTEHLLDKLRKNAKNVTQPVVLESDDEEEKYTKKDEPIHFPETDEEPEQPDEIPEDKIPKDEIPEDEIPKEAKGKKRNPPKPQEVVGRIMQFHSKSPELKPKTDKPYLDAGMPKTAMSDLSNFANFSVEYDGKIFPTVEHAFQSQKYKYAKYEPQKPKKNAKAPPKETTPEEIINEFTVEGNMSALDAKKAGGRTGMEARGFKLDAESWGKASGPIMHELIKSKVERNEQIRKILEVAKTFDIKLAHFSRSDMKWGCNITADGTAILRGENQLGDIYNDLMYGEEHTLSPFSEIERPDSPNPIPSIIERPDSPNPIPSIVARPDSPNPIPSIVARPIKELPKPSVPVTGPIMFDSDDEEETGGAKKAQQDPADLLEDVEEEDVEEEDEDEEQYGEDELPDGRHLKPINPFLKKLRKKDPVLFMTKPNGKFKSFSTSCQPTSRHPVILSKDELDRTDKGAYKHAIKYGSDPKNPNYFICPRFWCFLTNSAISEEDVKAGKCGAIIDKKTAEKIPKGSYVYELNEEAHIPGFIENKLADGKCLPCCFKKTWDNKTQMETRKRCESQMENPEGEKGEDPDKKTKPKKHATKPSQYIYSLDTYPVPQQRWGFLPIPVQLFLQIDYRPILDPNNPALIQPDKETFLRWGTEQTSNQSFLGCFADIYAHRQGLDAVPSIDEFKRILTKTITLDTFVKAHNGSLLSAFYPKTQKPVSIDKQRYRDTEFALSLDLTEKANKRHFDDAVVAYENFVAYLSNPESKIDHQYLWDFVCDDNRNITPKGLNLVILEIKANNIIDRIELVCPTNLYSRNQYDTAKDTVILLKHDNFYEPIYMYEATPKGSPKVVRFFSHSKVPDTVADMLRRIEHSTRKYCPGLPSLPKIYRFANAIPILRMLGALVKIKAKIDSQVVNYQGKTIGLMVVEQGESGSIYIPCAPSARLRLPIKYMDSSDIPKEYEKTLEALRRISSTAKIPCAPVWKIKEDGMVVGFLTESNQFVPIKPNEDIIADGLHTYEGVDTFAVDKTVATEQDGDQTRITLTKYIVLESQFYHAFRNRVRTLFAQFENRQLKNEISKIADDKTLLYSQKIQQIEPLIERLIEGYVVFVKIGESVLMDMAEVNECDDADDEGPSCIIKENGVAQLAIPKLHLLSKHDNEKIYVGRMADELVRNYRVKSMMYDTTNRLNSRTADYQIKDDEFILVQSALTTEYFSDLDANVNTNSYVANTNYELANPSISVVYPNERIPLTDQYANETGDRANSCLVRVSKIIGNQKQVWDRIFSENSREHVFRDTANCTFQPLIHIVKSKLDETWSVTDAKNRLSDAYLKLFEINPANLPKVAKILREQGKSRIFEKFVTPKLGTSPEEFKDIIISDGYHLTDMDLWVLANEYNLPIVVFNANGLKGFFAKHVDVNTQWIKMGGDKGDLYHFIRSKIHVAKGSYANHVYEYNLIVPGVKLNQTKEFGEMVVESVRMDGINTTPLAEALERFF